MLRISPRDGSWTQVTEKFSDSRAMICRSLDLSVEECILQIEEFIEVLMSYEHIAFEL